MGRPDHHPGIYGGKVEGGLFQRYESVPDAGKHCLGQGIDVFCERDIPFLRQYDTNIIVNVCGKTEEEYCAVAERLAEGDVDMLEINISCVRSAGLYCSRHIRYARHIRAQLHNDRLLRILLHCFRNGFRRFWILAERDAALCKDGPVFLSSEVEL